MLLALPQTISRNIYRFTCSTSAPWVLHSQNSGQRPSGQGVTQWDRPESWLLSKPLRAPWASHLSQGQPQQPTLRSTSPLGAPTRPSPSPSCQSRHRSGHRPPGQSGQAAQGVGLVLCRGFRAPSKRGCGFGFCPRERKAQPWYLLGRRQGTQRSWDGDHEQASRVPKNARFHRTGWPCPLSSGLW